MVKKFIFFLFESQFKKEVILLNLKLKENLKNQNKTSDEFSMREAQFREGDLYIFRNHGNLKSLFSFLKNWKRQR